MSTNRTTGLKTEPAFERRPGSPLLAARAGLSARRLGVAAVLFTVILTYANSFNNGFHFDDFHTITDNPAVRSLSQLPRIFRDTTAFSVLPANQTYRPIVTASLALDYALGHGYVPFWFHLSTLIWFLLLILVLFRWAENLFDKTQPALENRWFALGVAAWFGLHPAMAETVNYIIQRGDLYCTLGCLGALLLYVECPGQRRYGWYLLPFVLAMLSKPPASVFPVLLLLYVFFFETEGQGSARRWFLSFRAALPAVACTGLLLWLQSVMTPKSYAPSILSAAAYRLTQPYVWFRYTEALFLPLHLNVDTDLQPFAALNGAAALGLLFTCGLLVAIVLCSRRRVLYPIAYGLSWFLVTQLPTSLYTLSEVENDHRMFFSFPGLMLAVVWALGLGYARWLDSRKAEAGSRAWLTRSATVCAVLLLCGYAYGAHRRNAVWRDESSLWADDVSKSPHNGRGLMIFGLTRMNAGDLQGAKALFERALQYTPNYPTLEINLGVVNGLLADRGHPELSSVAEQHFQRAVPLAPGDDLPHAYYGRWLLGHDRAPEAIQQLELAVGLNRQREMQRDLLLQAYVKNGQADRALALARQVMATAPEDGVALSIVQGRVPAGSNAEATAMVEASLRDYRAGNFAACIAEARRALQLDAHMAEAWNNLGAGYGALRLWDQGTAAERQALVLNPGLTIAANNLHWFQAEQSKAAGGSSAPERKVKAAALVNESLRLNRVGAYPKSREAAVQALALDPDSAEAWNNIAADAEAVGDWQNAIEAAQHALQLKPDFQLARNNLAWSLSHVHGAAKP